MPIETVTVVWTEEDIGQAGLNGSVRFVLSSAVSLGPVTYEPVPRIYPITNSAGQTTPPILANDTPGLQPPGSFYTISVLIPGMPPRVFPANVWLANGASQTLSDLAEQHLQPSADYQGYMPLSGAGFLGAVSPKVITATDAPLVTITAGLGNYVRWTLGGNRELQITPGADGQKILFELIQDATGGRALTFGDSIAFLPGLPQSAITLTPAPGARNFLGFSFNAVTGLWYCLAFI